MIVGILTFGLQDVYILPTIVDFPIFGMYTVSVALVFVVLIYVRTHNRVTD